MKQALQWKIVQFLTWFLARLAPNPPVFEQNFETSMRTLDELWQTSAVHQYLDGREATLKELIVSAVAEGRPADKLSVGLHEIRSFKDKLKAAHVYMKNRKERI